MVCIGDVFEIHINERPSVYARLEGIEADVKPGWFKVRLLLLTFPAQEVTWILRREYLEGSGFTMQNVPMRIVPLRRPKTRRQPTTVSNRESGKVIPLRRTRDILDETGDAPGDD